MRVLLTYSDDIVGVCAVEVGYPYASGKRLLPLECLVEAFAKVWLNTQSLQHKDAHPHEALLCGIIPLINGIVEYKNHKVVSAISVDDEGAEALVALESFPE